MPGKWSDPVEKAQKILGPKAKIPKPNPEMLKASGELASTYADYRTAVDSLEVAIQALQSAATGYRSGLRQLGDAVVKTDFGLDTKNEDNKKKIAQAQKILTDWIDEQLDAADKDAERIDDLSDHLAGLGKYKGPTSR